ncbi:uncharacterized protein KY384_005914 [Bacidia gigantensis]|uniref:uncharacterized protein n=1 Tax=Bacidia gigantensis TaxID=2732470 RepID=UPI001D05B0DA|nr:uncharacterized protein KY384_005914 [Bacidia gigantensis]KAG8529279.1 hypothetical protein KY384_005914 [Bacidia gigantensis]
MDPETVQQFLDEQRDAAPEELQQDFLNLEDYWDRKLWHQLTDLLIELFDNRASSPQRLPLFRHFILSFSEKINQLKFVALGLAAATQCQDDQERLDFFTDLAKKVNKPSSQDAYVYALVAGAEVKLRLQDLEGARKDLDTAELILDTFDSVEVEVHAAFYRTSASYYQAKADFALFYRSTLLYLACIETNALSSSESQHLAYDLSIAALISDSIYNFGELLLHPLLSTLKSTPHAWLRDVLYAFNKGDLAAYDALKGNFTREPLLEQHQTFLYQKISLAALTEAVFRRPPHDRAMTFRTISRETNVKVEDIEILIMKALSLGLLKGSIDQVGGVARINWVQPKVLDLEQIGGMRGRLREWDGSVNKLGNWIEGVGKDVWAA